MNPDATQSAISSANIFHNPKYNPLLSPSSCPLCNGAPFETLSGPEGFSYPAQTATQLPHPQLCGLCLELFKIARRFLLLGKTRDVLPNFSSFKLRIEESAGGTVLHAYEDGVLHVEDALEETTYLTVEEGV
jgi:hypothetical protein